MRLKKKNAVLVVIDVQGKLAELAHDAENVSANISRLIEGADALDVTVIWTEQLPDKMGPTIKPIRDLLKGFKSIAKSTFSCCGDSSFMSALKGTRRKQVILVGIESHVCVSQTAIDLIEKGYEVFVVTDAVSSRTVENRQAGITRMNQEGAYLCSTEMVLFELLGDASHSQLKTILRLVK